MNPEVYIFHGRTRFFMKTWLLAYLISCCVCVVFAVEPASATVTDDRPPREVVEKVKPAIESCRRALREKHGAGVQKAVAEAIKTLGPWAGVPESDTIFYPPPQTTPFDVAKVRKRWLNEVERGMPGLPWEVNPEGDPRLMNTGLRAAAFPLDGLARTAMLFPDKRDELTLHVRKGADWLITIQHPSGVFPFPVGPGLKPRGKVGRIVERMIKQHPERVVNDWIPDDFTDGGLQFDNGLCGSALISAWEATQDDRYLAAAKRSGDWALARPLVFNWNYNAFSVGLLARLAVATGETRYRDAAVEKAKIGVLPGQMSSGRWFDPHNACAVYHNILLRELLELLNALPDDHPDRPMLADAIQRGLDQAAEETLQFGYSGTWTDNFARGLQWLGENETWRCALNVNLNASGQAGAPSPGFAALAVLEGLEPEHKRLGQEK